MTWESDEETPDAGRDRSKLMWYGVAAILAIMLVLLILPRSQTKGESRARVRHILVSFDQNDPASRVKAIQSAETLRDRLLKGESFSNLAKEFSADEFSGPRGGDLGWLGHGDLEDAIDAWIWTAPLNEVSEVIETGVGFHLVEVTERVISDAEQYERELHQRVLDGTAGEDPAP